MRKILGAVVLLAFFFSIAAPIFAASVNDQIAKLQNEIASLQSKLAKTKKSKTQIARINRTIKGHEAKIEELKKDPGYKPQTKLEITKVQVIEGPQTKILSIKGGLAGGADLIGADFLMPVGPVYLGGEAGYAIGNQFGIIDLAGKVVYSLGMPFVGLEVSYAGYSKDVTNVPGLSGTIKSGIGIGLIGGTSISNIQLTAGYNTILGLKADAGYRLHF